MFVNRFHRLLSVSAVGVALLAVLSGCDSSTAQNSNTGSVAITATATCTPTATSITRVSGKVKSATASSLVITKQNGSSVTASLSSSTTFMQQVLVARSALTDGMTISVTVTQSADGSSYTADVIQLTTGTGFAGFGNGQQRGGNFPRSGSGSGGRTSPCGFRGSGGFGGAGNSGGAGGFGGGAANSNGNRLIGTIAQVSGNTLTIADTSNNDYSLTLTNQTQIIQTKKANASSLKAGENVSLTGSTASGSTVVARSVSIMLASTGTTPTSTSSSSGV
jgi:Predicted membrane protein